MRKYVIELTIEEGSDEFWEEATADGKSGCDEVLRLVRDCLNAYGFRDDEEYSLVRLKSYSER